MSDSYRDSRVADTGTERGRFPLSLIYQAARMYYIEDATQVEIASRLNVSRPTVSRLVAEARRAGIVKIEVLDPFADRTVVLAEDLRAMLGLNAVHLAAVTNAATLGADLADSVARAISGMSLESGDALLLSSGRTTYEIAHAALPPLVGVELAPAVGGQTEPLPWFQTNETTRVAAAQAGATPTFIFAQALPSARMRASLDDDPTFQHVVALWRGAKGALLGIGAPPASRAILSRGIPVEYPSLDDAAGDVCLNFFRPDGSAISFPGSDRMVRVTREMLQAIPHAVGVAVGVDKVSSIVGAVRAGLINELVSDSETAQAVLRHAEKGL